MTNLQYFFHIELPDGHTRPLKRQVFRTWPEVEYLSDHNLSRLLRLPDNGKCLISSDTLLGPFFASIDERCRRIASLAQMFPDANVMLSFRPHSDFLASMYSHYLTHGGYATFDEFFSSKESRTVSPWRRQDLNYKAIIEAAETEFGKQPFVFLEEEIETNTNDLKVDMAKYFDTPAPKDIEVKVEPGGLGAWQGNVLRQINRLAETSYAPVENHHPYSKLRRWRLDPANICLRVFGKLPAGPLISGEVDAEIVRFYHDDWQYVRGYHHSSPYRRSS